MVNRKTQPTDINRHDNIARSFEAEVLTARTPFLSSHGPTNSAKSLKTQHYNVIILQQPMVRVRSQRFPRISRKTATTNKSFV